MRLTLDNCKSISGNYIEATVLVRNGNEHVLWKDTLKNEEQAIDIFAVKLIERFPKELEGKSVNDIKDKLHTLFNQEKDAQLFTKEDGHNLTDLGNAERFVSQHGPNIRYSFIRGKFLFWNGQHWVWSDGPEIWDLAKETVRSIYQEAAQEPDDSKRADIAKWAKQSESNQKLSSMIEIARHDLRIQISPDKLDSNPMLLNCQNGTLDLRTGILRQPQREDFLTLIIPTPFNPDAVCPIWENFIETITNRDEQFKGYLQRITGYSLTGDTRAQCLFFLYGLGSNGKSTFVDAIHRLLGPYAMKADVSLFMAKDRQGGSITEGLANLQGKRFVIASEIEEGQRLAVSLVKDVTGCEPIRANRKYEHEIEFRPIFKLWISGNHQPEIRDTTHSIWRRIKRMPFTVTISDEARDEDLPRKLHDELQGILAWAVRGCLQWQLEGLGEPDIVRNATDEYRIDQDILADFISDRCTESVTGMVTRKDMYESYSQWCSDNGQKPISTRNFTSRLRERGIDEHKIHGQRYWLGVDLCQVNGGTLGAGGTLGQ